MTLAFALNDRDWYNEINSSIIFPGGSDFLLFNLNELKKRGKQASSSTQV